MWKSLLPPFLNAHIWYYSNIPLIWLAWNQTGAKLLFILDYQVIPVLRWVLTGNFLLLLLYLSCTTNQRNIPLDITYECLFKIIRVLFMFWILHSWRSLSRRQGVKRFQRHSGLMLFLICPCDLPVSLMGLFFLVKSKSLGLGTILFKWQITGISELSGIGLKEFCCICFIFDHIVKNVNK